MALSIGIIGLPNVGKSTLFNALLKRQAALAANYPFATIEPNVGVVDVPDARLERLAEIVRVDYGNKLGDRTLPEKIIPATVQFYDIAGLVKGASQGEGLGNEFLGHIRGVDALVQVVRDFSDENIIRAGSTTPEDDISIINTELILADLQIIEKRVANLERDLKSDKTDDAKKKYEMFKVIKEALGRGELASSCKFEKENLHLLRDANLLTLKPMIYAFNVDEDNVSKLTIQTDTSSVNDKVYISAKIESELASLDENEKKEFMDSLGISSSGLDLVIKAGYSLLGLESFLTMGPKEVRAWTYKRGSTAPQAAGVIHTDFERGFIAADIINFDTLSTIGSEKKAKEEGKVRLEGKSYVMHDGDIVEFRFNV